MYAYNAKEIGPDCHLRETSLEIHRLDGVQGPDSYAISAGSGLVRVLGFLKGATLGVEFFDSGGLDQDQLDL